MSIPDGACEDDVAIRRRPAMLSISAELCMCSMCSQMYRQGDRERDLGLPISPLMDRTKGNGITKSQKGVSCMKQPSGGQDICDVYVPSPCRFCIAVPTGFPGCLCSSSTVLESSSSLAWLLLSPSSSPCCSRPRVTATDGMLLRRDGLHIHCVLAALCADNLMRTKYKSVKIR